MTLVKCAHCGAERDLAYNQIEVVNREERKCPACSIGTEQVVVKETRFQPFDEHIKAHGQPTEGPAFFARPPASEPEEPKADENAGITVGPGGSVIRRRNKPATD